jgi:hypothetical protein
MNEKVCVGDCIKKKLKLDLQYSLDPPEPEFVNDGPQEFVQLPPEPAAVGPVPAELYISMKYLTN